MSKRPAREISHSVTVISPWSASPKNRNVSLKTHGTILHGMADKNTVYRIEFVRKTDSKKRSVYLRNVHFMRWVLWCLILMENLPELAACPLRWHVSRILANMKHRRIIPIIVNFFHLPTPLVFDLFAVGSVILSPPSPDLTPLNLLIPVNPWFVGF